MSVAEPTNATSTGRYAEAILAEERLNNSTPRAGDFADDEDTPTEDSKKDGKAKKRSLFGFGKKKAPTAKKSTDASKSDARSQSPSKSNSATTSPPSLSRDASKASAGHSSTWATQGEQSFVLPSSPSRGFTGSPRLSSPATSQIFERDVQESTILNPTSPAIPTHIQTENYIPSVLDDASEAITNHELDPDTVEIVTHTSHQPAAVTINPCDQTSSEWAAELASFADRDIGLTDSASNYGSLDSSDVRRLSFISFADVVQAEHGPHSAVPGSRDSIHLVGLTSLPAAVNRSPSPIRSPVSSQGGPETSPPTSNPGSMKGIELSPRRKPLGSPTSITNLNINAPGGDLNIETMSQALRRTGSADLSNVRSIPTSPTEPSKSPLSG
ncbi:hypothetical protein EDB81DRAFT_462640 [Dactylonectria macrodidyma]|uniref:Uncharacterized protein n=1 Tax=Dactylonectria macrodidyma TaxID=307937 RepID=A0A9P9J9R2_9HYPO|nr:hypothetical protein EDB81DRAFT_462640 [Dactylonectria macrodidyma]